MKRAIILFSILGSVVAALADPQTGQPSVPTNSIMFPQLLSPTDSVLMTNAEFRCFSGNRIFFRNDNDYQSFRAAELNTNVLAALHITAAQLEAQQKNLDAAKQRYKEEAAAAARFGNPQIGQPAPNFRATDIFGKRVNLSDYKGKIVVMETFYSGCAWCKNHYGTGAMQELQRELTNNGVVWLVIGCQRQTKFVRTVEDTPASTKKIWAQSKMVITDWIADTDAQIARSYGIRTTPQMFVINTNGVLAYQGALDNHPAPDGNPRTARNYVREAVRALLAGKKMSVPETKPYGCAILYDGMSDAQSFQPSANLFRR